MMPHSTLSVIIGPGSQEEIVTEYRLEDLMQKAIDAFQPQNAAGIDALIQLHLAGDQGGDWFVTIRDQALTLDEGVRTDADLTFKANTQDLFSVVNGQLNPMQAVLSGKVQFQGDIGLAMRLLEVFRRPESWKI
jgi:putative sterol carrier protein